MPRPNLFIIGAMKSGTSSLHRYLGSHPEIFMSSPKEPMFFSRDVTSSEEVDAYLELFETDRHVKYLGESSTSYTKVPRFAGAAERIYAFNPDARLIYIMRDPVERTISQYWHMVRNHGERRPILRAIRQTPEYTQISYYAMQIKQYLAVWKPENLYILTLEEMKRDLNGTLQEIFKWLGVDPSFLPADIERKHVTPPVVHQARGLGVLNAFRKSPVWQTVRPIVPAPLRTVGSRLGVRRVDRKMVSVAETVQYLKPIQRCQTEELSHLLGRQFPEWRTLYGSNSQN